MLPSWLIWCVWLTGVGIWSSEVLHQLLVEHRASGLIISALILPFLLFIFLCEGMEIAVADLNDKDADQLGDRSLRVTLRQIKTRQSFFIANQQAFALCLVTLLTTMTNLGFKAFWLPFYGPITNDFAIGGVNFVFLSLLILCLCQVPAKKLAISNSEQFLQISKRLWPIIQITGALNLSGPAGYVEEKLRPFLGFSERRLLPNRSSHYNATALIQGYCCDQTSLTLSIATDGSAAITRCFLATFLHGSRKVLTGRMRVGPSRARLKNCNVSIVGAWKLTAREDLKEYNDVLDRLLDTAMAGQSVSEIYETSKQTGRSIDPIDLSQSSECYVSAGTEEYDWRIKFLNGLPDSYCRSDEGYNENIICIAVRITGSADPGSFVTENGSTDCWTERFIAACRKFRFTVEAQSPALSVSVQKCDVGLEHVAATLEEESKRASKALTKGQVVHYPVQSALYTIKWESLTPAQPLKLLSPPEPTE